MNTAPTGGPTLSASSVHEQATAYAAVVNANARASADAHGLPCNDYMTLSQLAVLARRIGIKPEVWFPAWSEIPLASGLVLAR